MDKIDEYFDKALVEKASTKVILRSHIRKYFKIIDKDMETYFDNTPEYDDKDEKKLKIYNEYYEQDLRTYWKYLQGKAPNTRSVAISSIKGFLRRFDKKTRDLDIWDDISARMKGKSSRTEEHVPDIEEIKQILNYCDIRTKAIIMVALSSGMRISEATSILPTDVYLKETPTRINIRAEIAKNGKRRTTFITSEATEILKEWLRAKDKFIAKAMKHLNFKNMAHLKDKEKPEIFPYSPHRIREAFNSACASAGFTGKTENKGDFDLDKYYKKDHKFSRGRRKLHFHNLRKFFRTYFGNSDLAEHLMGHTGYLSTYRAYNDKQLSKEYLKHMENVTIYERSPDLSETHEKMSDMQQTIEDLKAQVLELKLEKNEKRLEKLEKKNGIK